MELTEKEAYKMYDEMLDELYPLDGINCNPFSILLKEGDPTAYQCGFVDWCDVEGINLDDLT